MGVLVRQVPGLIGDELDDHENRLADDAAQLSVLDKQHQEAAHKDTRVLHLEVELQQLNDAELEFNQTLLRVAVTPVRFWEQHYHVVETWMDRLVQLRGQQDAHCCEVKQVELKFLLKGLAEQAFQVPVEETNRDMQRFMAVTLEFLE